MWMCTSEKEFSGRMKVCNTCSALFGREQKKLERVADNVRCHSLLWKPETQRDMSRMRQIFSFKCDYFIDFPTFLWSALLIFYSCVDLWC